MSVGTLGHRARGAMLRADGNTSVPIVGTVAGGRVQLVGATAYDVLTYDSDGFADGHGLADGYLMARYDGLYTLRGRIRIMPPAAVAEMRGNVGFLIGADVRWIPDLWYVRPATVATNPLLDIEFSGSVEILAGELVNLNVILSQANAGNHDLVPRLFELVYRGHL